MYNAPALTPRSKEAACLTERPGAEELSPGERERAVLLHSFLGPAPDRGEPAERAAALHGFRQVLEAGQVTKWEMNAPVPAGTTRAMSSSM